LKQKLFFQQYNFVENRRHKDKSLDH